MVGCMAWSGFCAGAATPFFIVSVGGAAAHLSWQISTVDLSNPKDCLAKFKSNRDVGFLVLAGMLLAGAVAEETTDDEFEHCL